MGVLKMYLGGSALAIVGVIVILIAFFVGLSAIVQYSDAVCVTALVLLIIGAIMYVIGKFYVKVSKNTTPIIMYDKNQSKGHQQPPPPPPAPPAYQAGDTKEDIYEKMNTLKKMKDDGLISEEEYQTKKNDLLSKL